MGRRRSGYMGQDVLASFPLEILITILTKTNPGDLLTLARTNKRLRETILERETGQKIWEQSFRELYDDGLPTCPTGLLSEPRYAELLCKFPCTMCYKARAFKVEWDFLIRICKECTTENVLDRQAYEKDKTFRRSEQDCDLILQLIPRRANIGEGGSYYKPDFAKIHDILPKDIDREDLAAMAPWLERIEEMNKERDARSKLGDACRHWLEVRKGDASVERERMARERKLAIIDRLSALGQVPEDYCHLYRESYFRDPRPLTDRIWRNLQPKILEAIEKYRDECAIREAQAELAREEKKRLRKVYEERRIIREPILKKRYRSFRTKDVFDEMFVPDFSVIAKVNSTDDLYKIDDLDEFVAAIPSWLTNVEKVISNFHGAVQDELLRVSHGLSSLTDYQAVFRCRKCWTTGLTFPGMVNHNCFLGWHPNLINELGWKCLTSGRETFVMLAPLAKRIMRGMVDWLGHYNTPVGFSELSPSEKAFYLHQDAPCFSDLIEDWDLGLTNEEQEDRIIDKLTELSESDVVEYFSWRFAVEANMLLRGRLTPWLRSCINLMSDSDDND